MTVMLFDKYHTFVKKIIGEGYPWTEASATLYKHDVCYMQPDE